MTECPESKERVREKIEEIYGEVRALGQGGDLDGLMTRKLEEFNRLLREELADERGRWTASNEADFPPSGRVSALRPREDARVRKSGAKRTHAKRKRGV